MKHNVLWMMVLTLFWGMGCEREAPPPPATAPATQATTTTAPATRPVVTDYVDVIRAGHPQVPATQPLSIPVDLHDAGRYALENPVHLDLRGDLWFTHGDAPPLEQLLADQKIDEQQAHVVPQPVAFVIWARGEKGKWFPRLVVRDELGELSWRWQADRYPLPMDRGYRWEDAVLLAEEAVAVPGERGVSVFTFEPKYQENYHELVTSPDASPPQILLDPHGLLAWSPWEGKKPGGKGAARFIDGKWTQLGRGPGASAPGAPSDAWPDEILHLVPLLDGSVLQLVHNDDGTVRLAMATLDTSSAVDEEAITKLVAQLSDADPQKREAANRELTRYGTASWPLLEKLKDNQPPEARLRIESLLRDRIQPTLGGREPVDGRIEVASRLEGGGVLLHLPAGVSIARDDGASSTVKPAWISIRPGRAIELLEPVLVKDAKPGEQRFFAFGDEWIVSDPVQGPRRLYGNHLEAMLPKTQAAFVHVVDQDRRGRWLFRKSAHGDETLLLDPTLPDPTPKLPVWQMNVAGGKVGWNREDYPAVNRGGRKHSWILHQSGWRPLDENKDRLITEPPATPPPPAPEAVATTEPSTSLATTQATTSPAATTQGFGPPILVDREGRKYFDGRENLIVIDRDGNEMIWPLPPNATGGADVAVALLRIDDGKLFLFNAPGRVVRIKPTGRRDEPFIVEAVFTRRIPTPDVLHRIWLDPAGRIVMAYDKTHLAVLFPTGRIPRDIHILIPAAELEPLER
jgi:hypothetical protein